MFPLKVMTSSAIALPSKHMCEDKEASRFSYRIIRNWHCSEKAKYLLPNFLKRPRPRYVHTHSIDYTVYTHIVQTLWHTYHACWVSEQPGGWSHTERRQEEKHHIKLLLAVTEYATEWSSQLIVNCADPSLGISRMHMHSERACVRVWVCLCMKICNRRMGVWGCVRDSA